MQQVQALANISRSRYVVIATKSMHLLQIHPIVHKAPATVPPSYIWVRAVVWECGEGQTQRQTHRRAWPIYISPRQRLTLNIMNDRQTEDEWRMADDVAISDKASCERLSFFYM